MEWCEKIYGEWRSAEGLRRLERAAAVFILLLLAVIGIKDGYAGFPVMEGEYSADPEAGAQDSAAGYDPGSRARSRWNPVLGYGKCV